MTTLRTFKIISVLICALATIINLPYFFSFRLDIKDEFNASKNRSESIVYTDDTNFSNSNFYIYQSWNRQILVQYIPLILLCIFNFLLFQLVQSHNKKLFLSTRALGNSIQRQTSMENSNLIMKQSISKNPLKEKPSAREKKLRAQKKLTILLIAVILLFLMGQIPHSFAYIKIYKAIGNCGERCHESIEYQLFRLSTMVLTLLCYSLNFFIYIFLNIHFRQTLCCSNYYQRRKSTIKNGIEAKSIQPQNLISDIKLVDDIN